MLLTLTCALTAFSQTTPAGPTKIGPTIRDRFALPLRSSQITAVEVVSAVSRRYRGGNLTQKATQKSIARFKRDLQNRLRILRLTDTVVLNAMRLAETHGLRGYDAVQLAVAIELETRLVSNNLSPIVFVSADDNLNNAAQMEGLTVENPNDH